jgi:hypothetical protein
MGPRRLPVGPRVRPWRWRHYNGAVAVGPGSNGEEGGRPEFFTTQARFVLAVWLAVTLVLIVVYVIVLLLL